MRGRCTVRVYRNGLADFRLIRRQAIKHDSGVFPGRASSDTTRGSWAPQGLHGGGERPAEQKVLSRTGDFRRRERQGEDITKLRGFHSLIRRTLH